MLLTVVNEADFGLEVFSSALVPELADVPAGFPCFTAIPGLDDL